MTTPAKELGITGFFRINEGIFPKSKGIFPKSKTWLPFTNLEIKYDPDRNIMITTFKGKENEEITITDIKNIKYNNEITAKRGILSGSLTPKPNRIDFEGQWDKEYSNWSFSIDNPNNYNTIVVGIGNNLYKQQVQHTSVKRETELKNSLNDYIEKGILLPGATVDEYLQYELYENLISSDPNISAATAYQLHRSNDGGGKTRKRKGRSSRKKRTKHKKRASTKKHKKYKKNKKMPRTRKR
jgi:hypothetical protein